MSQPKLLIIDDNSLARETLVGLLAGSEYQIECASSGPEGISMATRLNPDVILLDVMMPGMDGFEVCRTLRSDPILAEVPIIMVTALDDRISRLTGLEVGADDFLSKPFDSTELEIRLKVLNRVNRYRHLVEDRKKLDEVDQQLQKQNEELKLLYRKILEVQETERRRLAVDLHDEIGQQLTGLTFLLKNSIDADEKTLRLECAKALSVSRELLEQVREMAINLRPSMLDDLGLLPSLVELIKRFSKQTKIKIIHNIDPLDEQRFSEVIETTVFRLVQEALTNIARHAEIDEAMVLLDKTPQFLRISVIDSGKGFDINALSPGKSTGISGMRERVFWSGGIFRIESASGEGTSVQAEFPL